MTDDYYFEGHTELHTTEDVDSTRQFSFTQLDGIDLHWNELVCVNWFPYFECLT